MRKLLIVAALAVFGAASAGSWYLYRGPSETAGADLLTFVPADSAYFIGYSEPYPAAEYYAHWRELMAAQRRQQAFDPARAVEAAGPAGGILAALLQAAYSGDRPSDSPLQQALDDDGVMGLYETEGLPVLRYRLDNPAAFREALDAAEARAGVRARSKDTPDVRRYPFAGAAGATNPPVLVLALRDGDAVMTLSVNGMADALPAALGDQPPARSLADTDRLQELARRHGTLPGATGYIDHAAFAAAVSGDPEAPLGRLWQALAQSYGREPPVLDVGCAADLQRIVETWPRTALGAVSIDASIGRGHGRAVLEIADQTLRDTLQRLRGHIPAPAGEGPASLGVGLDVAELVPVLQALAERARDREWRCPQLADLRQRIDTQQLSGLGMMTAMLGDVRGVTATLLAPPTDKGLPRAVLEIATARPQTLWQAASGFLGTTPAPKMGGEPVRVDHPMLGAQSVRIAVREARLVVLLGEADLPAAANGSLNRNGMLDVRYNLAKVAGELAENLDAVPSGVDADALDDDAEKLQRQLRAMDLRQELQMDITDHGLRFDIAAEPGTSG